MSSDKYRERLRDRRGPASLNASFRPALPNRRDPIAAIDDLIPAPPGVDPTPDDDEPATDPPPVLPPHNPTQTGLLSHFNETLANAGTNPPPPAPPLPLRHDPIGDMLREEDAKAMATINSQPIVEPPADEPVASSAAADEDNEPVEDGTEPLPPESDSLGKQDTN
jgi:hypothetical protein